MAKTAPNQPTDRPPRSLKTIYPTWGVGVVGVVVQWLDSSPVTQEPGVRFPAYWRESGVFKRGDAVVVVDK